MSGSQRNEPIRGGSTLGQRPASSAATKAKPPDAAKPAPKDAAPAAPAKDPPKDGIEVTVTPRPGKTSTEADENRKAADAAQEKIDTRVRKAVADAAPGGEAAEKAAGRRVGEDAARQLPAHKIKEIVIDVKGDRSTHTPNEGGPPPAPPPAPSK